MRTCSTRLLLLLAAAALGACSTAPSVQPAAAAAACPGWTARDFAAAPVLRVLRIHTDPATGDSAIDESPMPPKRTPLLKTGTVLLEYNFGPGKTQIVVAPPNLNLPLHKAPYKESFLILQGSATLQLGDGTRRELLPGTMTTFEDTDARIGHGGMTGPCGYVALNVVP